jgi:hypothetical protein
MFNKSYLLLLSFCFAATTTQAQKMNVLDYHKAFLDNIKSPNNQLISKYAPKWLQEGGQYYLQSTVAKRELNVNLANNYLTYKDHEGWNGQCYPTFKVYTRADGKQVLGVTEDSYTHHSYRSKYSYSAPSLNSSAYPSYDADMKALKTARRSGELTPEQAEQKKLEIQAATDAYLRQNDPYHLWNARPRPIKFWTYEGGTWTEVTDQVMSEFFSLEQMIAKTTATPQAGLTVSQHISENITHHIYPLYRIEQDKNEITVWVDEARLRLFTTEIEEFANAADNLTSRKTGLTKHLFNFIENTTYKTYTLVWDDKAGKFVRKK